MTSWLRWVVLLPLAIGGTAAAEFRPVEDIVYRYDTTETRTVDAVERRFQARRSVVFHRTVEGYDAIVTLESVDQQAGGDVGAMFVAATGALRGHPLRFRLDPAGTVSDVERADVAIDLIATAIERMTARPASVAGRADDSRALASPLRSMPPERRRAMLFSIVAPLIDAAGRPPGVRAVTLPSRPPLPPGALLSGTETITRDGDIMTIDTHATGDVAARPPGDTPGAAAADGAAPTTERVAMRRRIDARSGLLIDARETTDTQIVDGETVRRTRIDSLVTLSADQGPPVR